MFSAFCLICAQMGVLNTNIQLTPGEGEGGRGGGEARQFLKAPFRGVMPFKISLEGVKTFCCAF